LIVVVSPGGCGQQRKARRLPVPVVVAVLDGDGTGNA